MALTAAHAFALTQDAVIRNEPPMRRQELEVAALLSALGASPMSSKLRAGDHVLSGAAPPHTVADDLKEKLGRMMQRRLSARVVVVHPSHAADTTVTADEPVGAPKVFEDEGQLPKYVTPLPPRPDPTKARRFAQLRRSAGMFRR